MTVDDLFYFYIYQGPKWHCLTLSGTKVPLYPKIYYLHTQTSISCVITQINGGREPNTVKDALRDPQLNKAMEEEFQALKQNNT